MFTSQQLADIKSIVADELKKNQKSFLSISEAAEYLGLAKQTLYCYASQNTLTHYKSQGGKRVYFKIQDLESFALHECREADMLLQQWL